MQNCKLVTIGQKIGIYSGYEEKDKWLSVMAISRMCQSESGLVHGFSVDGVASQNGRVQFSTFSLDWLVDSLYFTVYT